MNGRDMAARLARLYPRDASGAAEALGLHPATLRRYKRRAEIPRTVELALAAIELGVTAHRGETLILAIAAGGSSIAAAIPTDVAVARLLGATRTALDDTALDDTAAAAP